MRLTTLAAGILTLSLAGIPGLGGLHSRADGATAKPSVPAQNDQQQPAESSQTLKVQTNLVNVFATVRDKKNGIINDLTQDDFKIYEDGMEQKVAFFSKDMNLPITLGILMDTSGSMQAILGAEQDAASRFVHTVMRKKDEAVILSFDFDINLLADFTEDPSVLERAIRRTEISAVSSAQGCRSCYLAWTAR